MLELHNIVKTYGEKRALDNFSLQLENGLYGLLGENGAGKSTLIKILTCNLKQDEGSKRISGQTFLSEEVSVKWDRSTGQ